jgi:mannose-6-phosphate isomerase-like protein (cupin superfamily)
MNAPLLIAAVLVLLVSAAHSYLGERYILIRLFRRSDLPKLFGSDEFTRATLRFAWHLTSVAWVGLAGVIVLIGSPTAVTSQNLAAVVTATFGFAGAVALLGSHGRHLSWIAFFTIAALVWFGRGAVAPAAPSNRPGANVSVLSLHAPEKPLPAQSYERAPQAPFVSSDYVVRLTQTKTFYDVPGEFGHMMDGQDYGFEALSFILTETHPNGGPPLHTHETEEAHVLLHGEVSYVIGDRRFTTRAPYVARVPAGTPHTFINTGSAPFNLVAVFPSKRLTYKEVGPNPLVKKE